jgi:hypothetical protein
MAIEIKRTPAGAGYLNRPIGVTNIKTGSERIALAQADVYKTASNIAFQFADATQKAEAEKAGIEVLVTDEYGVKGYQPISGFGRSNEVANNIYNKRYSNALQRDVEKFANQLHLDGLTPEEFSELYNGYVGDTLKNISESGGDEFVSLYGDALYRIGDGHLNKIISDRINVAETQATADYLEVLQSTFASLSNLRGNAREIAYKSALDDLNENGAEAYGLQPVQQQNIRNRLADNYVNGIFNEEGRNAPLASLLAIQDPANWDSEKLQKIFPQTIKQLKSFDDDRLNAFNNRVSNLFTDRKALSELDATTDFVRQNYQSGTTNGGDKKVRAAVDVNLGYESEQDALMPSVQQASVENNAAHPGEYLQTIAERAVDAGLYNVGDIVPLMSRLANIDAAQTVSGRTISQYFGGGTKGRNIEALYNYLSGVGRGGSEKMIDAYTRRASVDRETLIQTMITNSEYPVKVGETPSPTQIARHYLDSSSEFEDVPLAAREDMLAQAEYLLGFPDSGNVAKALYKFGVEDYVPSIFYEPSRVNSDFSMYGYRPESYLSPQGAENLKQDLDSYSQDGESLFLKPILSSGISAKYIAYSVDKKGGQVPKVDGNGNPIVFDTQRYRIANEVIQNSRNEQLRFMRAQALSKETTSKRLAKLLMQYQILD